MDSGFNSARSSFQKDSLPEKGDDEVRIPGNIRLMYLANEGDVDGIRELIKEADAEASGGTIDVNYADVHGRTALHVAACQGYVDVVKFLVENEALLDPIDQMGNTVCKIEDWSFFCILYFLPCVFFSLSLSQA